MGEITKEVLRQRTYKMCMDEAEISRVLSNHLAERACGLTPDSAGVTVTCYLREEGAQGVTGVQVVADLVMTVDEMKEQLTAVVPGHE